MTDGQRKLFFALLDELGIDKKEAEERAIAKFGLKKFTNISATQIDELIKILEKQKRTVEHVHGDREYDFRIYDYETKSLYYLDSVSDGLVNIPLNGKWYIDEAGKKHNVHVMQYTGIKDAKDIKLFDYDFIQSPLGKKYTIQWSRQQLGWVAHDMETDEPIALSILQKCWKIGSPYEEPIET